MRFDDALHVAPKSKCLNSWFHCFHCLKIDSAKVIVCGRTPHPERYMEGDFFIVRNELCSVDWNQPMDHKRFVEALRRMVR